MCENTENTREEKKNFSKKCNFALSNRKNHIIMNPNIPRGGYFLMRVIAGSARHIQLKTVEGMETRPTTDRIKETLFNMLQNDIPGAYFLDLFSGSGAIGIEALSRGARCADFVEKNPKAVSCIRENLTKTHLTNGNVFTSDVFTFIKSRTNTRPYDVIFMDPPYNQMLEKRVLESLMDSSLSDENTLIIFEASLDTEYLSYISGYGYTVIKEKNYKTNKHVFVKRL